MGEKGDATRSRWGRRFDLRKNGSEPARAMVKRMRLKSVKRQTDVDGLKEKLSKLEEACTLGSVWSTGSRMEMTEEERGGQRDAHKEDSQVSGQEVEPLVTE